VLQSGEGGADAGVRGIKLGLQYSDELLEYAGGPRLQLLTSCAASELPETPNYIDAAVWNLVCGCKFKDQSVTNLDVAFCRQTNSAIRQYKIGRTSLQKYIEALEVKSHSLNEYHVAIESFEHCLSAVWKAVELFQKSNDAILNISYCGVSVFKKDDNSILERINLLHGTEKHWTVEQAKNGSAPLWITNVGLECSSAKLSFDELNEVISDLVEICCERFVEIPKLARQRQDEKAMQNSFQTG
jgi:hypothetical protein